MSDNLPRAIILIIICVIIIIMIPILLDYLAVNSKSTKKTRNQIQKLAEGRALSRNKSLIIFDGRDHGWVIDKKSREEFRANLEEILNDMSDNCCVVLLVGSLEYVDDPSAVLRQLEVITGGDLYLLNVDPGSPRIFWDYKIKNVMEKPFNLPGQNVKWTQPSKPQLLTQKIYQRAFSILPYNFFHSILKI